MTRSFSTDQANALQSSYVRIVMFADLDFPSGKVYVHTGIGTYSWGGNDYSGVGDLASVSSVEEGMDVSPYAITLGLSGLDSTITGAALDEDYYMHDVDLYLGLLDEDDELIGTPTLVWSGYMDQMNLTMGKSAGDSIQLIAESELSRFNKSRNLMYTNVLQQERFSGDLFFNHIHKVQGTKIMWGQRGGSGAIDNPQTPGDIKEYREQ